MVRIGAGKFSSATFSLPLPLPLIAAAVLLAGFLVSTEIISEIRVPFTHKVLWARRTEAREATKS